MTYRYFFLDSGGSSQHFFLTFLSIDEEVTSCSSRNEGKGPPSPSLPGGSWRGTKSRPPPSPFRDRGATKSLQKRRRRPQTHPELENKKKKNFLNRNASTKLPFHIDRRGMNSFLPFPTPARNPAGALKVRPNFITFCAPLTSSMRMIH